MTIASVKTVTDSPKDHKTDLLVVGMFEGRGQSLDWLNKALDGALTDCIKRKEFTGKAKQSRLFATIGKLPAAHVLVMGMGKASKASIDILRCAAGRAAKQALKLCVKNVAIAFSDILVLRTSPSERAQAATEGLLLGLYTFDKYKTDEDKKELHDARVLCGRRELIAVQAAVKTASVLAEAQCHVRDLVNEPACVLTPAKLAEHAKKLAKLGVKVTVYDKKGIEKLGLHALLAVNAGSAQEPRFIVLEWGPRKDPVLALVGKGITFDSGGLDIKVWPFMQTMKMDMSGAATVLGIIKAAAALKLKVHLVGVMTCTENMPDGRAYKTGDVYKTYSGKTIEIVNTDAEGRVALCDALAYAEMHFKPKAIFDFATLTGAITVALGNNIAGVMGNSKPLYERLYAASEFTGERIWELPLDEEFKEEIKGDVGDVRNLGKGHEGGALTAAAFLSYFIEKTPWLHFDIAGAAWKEKADGYYAKGGTGFGLRTVLRYLQSLK